jgi:putative membrane protein
MQNSGPGSASSGRVAEAGRARRAARVRLSSGPIAAYAAILVMGASLWYASGRYPAEMPVWTPYEFSWPIWLSVTLAAFWYARGVMRLAPADRPSRWEQAAFWLGLAVVYAVTQTQFEYLAQRMFFTNRIQHVAMHHLGPFLLALSLAGPAMAAGGPAWLQAACQSRLAAAVLRVTQQPAIAALLFVGLFFLWLVPAVHFRAMLDPVLYQVMNWSMVLDGILFWALVLDSRRAPPARASYRVRGALAIGVMFPQIMLGVLITFAAGDIYPYYEFCGRYYREIDAIADQQLGGTIVWLAPAMMSIVGLLIVIGRVLRHQQVP